MIYLKKLKNPRWQRKRLEIFQRDKWTCQECGSTSNCLHVHHRFYEPDRDPCDCEDENLITLCGGCHCLEHRRAAPGDRIASLRELQEWWVVLNNPVGLPWHIEQLKHYLERQPYRSWRIVGIYPTAEEASAACDEFERRLKIRRKGVAL